MVTGNSGGRAPSNENMETAVPTTLATVKNPVASPTPAGKTHTTVVADAQPEVAHTARGIYPDAVESIEAKFSPDIDMGDAPVRAPLPGYPYNVRTGAGLASKCENSLKTLHLKLVKLVHGCHTF